MMSRQFLELATIHFIAIEYWNDGKGKHGLGYNGYISGFGIHLE